MVNLSRTFIRSHFGRCATALTIGTLSGLALAQSVPLSFFASPDIYKVIAENDQYRVIQVTWKPGERDQPHAHPMAAVYFLTDCVLRSHAPDGTTQQAPRKAGFARVQPAVAEHSVENIGPADCQAIMFEPK